MPGTRVPAGEAWRSRVAAAAALRALEAGRPIAGRVLVVVAHPDDETVGLGARLAGFERLTLLHLTDGAPEAPDDWRRSGLPSRAAYAAERARELDRALARLCITPRRVALGVRDQQAALRLAELARRLAPWVAEAELVVTHAYEGGHPDHDAAAFAVWAACRSLTQAGGRAPVRLEFAGYHLAHGARAAGRFWADAACPAATARIAPEALARKQAALRAHATQAQVLAWFDPAVERYRQAPDYDFAAAPPPGAALYDGFGWALTAARWRDLARGALRELGLGPAAWA